VARAERLFGSLRPIDRDILFLPDVLFEEADAPVERVLRPAMDGLWQAVGAADCLNYDQAGNWKPRR
jgi:hypothetical protein